MFAAGYNIATHKGYPCRTQLQLFVDEQRYLSVMSKFDEIVGLKYLKGMYYILTSGYFIYIYVGFHLNDSKQGLGSKADRHEIIGKGQLVCGL